MGLKQIVSTWSWDACLQNRHWWADCNKLIDSFYMEKTQQGLLWVLSIPNIIQRRLHIWTEHKNSDPRGRITAVKPLLGQFPLSYIRMFPATGEAEVWRCPVAGGAPQCPGDTDGGLTRQLSSHLYKLGSYLAEHQKKSTLLSL